MAKNSFKRFIGLSSFEMMAMFRRGLFYAYLSIYLRRYLGLSVTETTLFATFPMIFNILCQTFVWGKVSDRFQLRRTLIIVGELLAGAGTVAVWYLHRIPESPVLAGYAIILGLTAIEIFWSMSNIAWSALVSDMYEAGERGGAQGRLASMGGVGRMAGVWIGGLLYDGLGLRFEGWGFYDGALFFISAGVMFVSTIPLFFLPEGGARELSPGVAAISASGKPDPKSARVYLAFLFAMIFINFGRNSTAIIIPQYLSLDSGLALDSRTISHVVNVQSAAIILFGWAAGRIGRMAGDANALLAATAAAVLALFMLAGSTALPVIYASSFLRGVADVVLMSSSYAMASVLIPPESRARLFAWFNATFFLSWGLAGTLIAGPVVDFAITSGWSESLAYRASFGSAGGFTLIGLALMYGVIGYRKRNNL